MIHEPFTAYLAAEGFEEQLRSELGDAVVTSHGRLLVTRGPRRPSVWAQNVWTDARVIQISSISDGAKKLRALQRNWALLPYRSHRRALLIQEQLPHVSVKPITFPSISPTAPMGSWMLLDDNTIFASPGSTNPYAHGEYHFDECKEGPPSRAYLKLWEALTRIRRWPTPGSKCLEVGASPGSWTWALTRLGATIHCIDRAPLDPTIAAHPNVHFRQGNAFTCLPKEGDKFDWIFSDVVCYPDKLLEWVWAWIDSGQCDNFVCTIKLQGTEHYSAIPAFAAIPGSDVIHLFHNKHELTWIKLANGKHTHEQHSTIGNLHTRHS